MIGSEYVLEHGQKVEIKGDVEEILKDTYYLGKAFSTNTDLKDHKAALILAFLLGADMTSEDLKELNKGIDGFHSQEEKKKKEAMRS